MTLRASLEKKNTMKDKWRENWMLLILTKKEKKYKKKKSQSIDEKIT